jgi:homoserine kinase
MNDSIGFEEVINKQIKPGSGIGSSSECSGSVVAANHLLGTFFKGSMVGS